MSKRSATQEITFVPPSDEENKIKSDEKKRNKLNSESTLESLSEIPSSKSFKRALVENYVYLGATYNPESLKKSHFSKSLNQVVTAEDTDSQANLETSNQLLTKPGTIVTADLQSESLLGTQKPSSENLAMTEFECSTPTKSSIQRKKYLKMNTVNLGNAFGRPDELSAIEGLENITSQKALDNSINPKKMMSPLSITASTSADENEFKERERRKKILSILGLIAGHLEKKDDGIYCNKQVSEHLLTIYLYMY